MRRRDEENPVGGVSELRVVLTVDDFEQAMRLYGDELGLRQLEDWSSADGRVVLFEAGRATLEIMDAAQADFVDQVEAGRRVSGLVRLAMHVDDGPLVSDRLVAGGAQRIGDPVATPWGDVNVRVATPEGVQLTLFGEPTTADR